MKTLFFLLCVCMVWLQAEALYKVTPSQMVLMDSLSDDETQGLVVHDRNGSADVEEEVISADEYLSGGDVVEEEAPLVDLSGIRSDKSRIALLVPRKVIGGYANSVANAILAYLIHQEGHFIFEVFDSRTQNPDDLKLALGKIHQKGYRLIIAPLTPKGANTLASLEHDALVYVPTVNSVDIQSPADNFLFGGIDYQMQIDALLQYANDKIVIFGDKSALAKRLSDYIRQKRLEEIVYAKQLKNPKASLEYLLKKNRRLKDASIFLNMPVVSSSLLAAQLTRYKVPYYNLLSTQVNYSPLLFTLTQYPDRKKLYIANAISEAPFVLQDINQVIGSDIRFNWIDYAASSGIDYIYTTYIADGKARIFPEEMISQQLYYDTRIMRAGEGSFYPAGLPEAMPSVSEAPVR